MGKEEKTIIAIDIGTSFVRVLAARSVLKPDVDIVAFGEAPSMGVKRGLVENVDEASYAIRAALEDAGVEGRMRAVEVYAGVGGKHIGWLNSIGQTSVSRNDRTVSEKDVVRAIQAAKAVSLGDDRQLLHHIPRAFRIDGYRCRRNPVGMHGTVAQAETHLVVASAAAIRDVKKAVQMAGKDVDQVVINGIAASQAVLSREEREAGVIMLDIGGGSTDIVAYSEGSVFHTSSLPLGGGHLSNDISIALNTAVHVGERVLAEYGAAAPQGIDLAEEVTVPYFGIAGYRRFRRQYLYEVIRLRLTEMFQLALGQVKQGGTPAPTPPSLVLTGGVANLPGIEWLAEQVLGMPTRIGRPPRQDYAPETLYQPQYSTLIGMMLIESDPLFAPVREQRNGNQNGFRLIPQFSGIRS